MESLPVDVDDIVRCCEEASSQTELENVLEKRVKPFLSSSMDVQERVVLHLLQNVTVVVVDSDNASLQTTLFETLDACHVLSILSVCCGEILKTNNENPVDESTLFLTLRYLRYRFLTVPNTATANHYASSSSSSASLMMEGRTNNDNNNTPRAGSMKQDKKLRLVDQLVSTLQRLPVQIANACHQQGLILPRWATRSEYSIRWIQSAIHNAQQQQQQHSDDNDDDDNGSFLSLEYATRVVGSVIQNGGCNEAAIALSNETTRPNNIGDDDDDDNPTSWTTTTRRRIVQSLSKTLSTRDLCAWMRSVVQHSVTTTTNNGLLDHLQKDLLLQPLQSTRTIQDAWVRLMVFHSSSVDANRVRDKLICQSVAQLLWHCKAPLVELNDDNDDDDDDDDDEVDDDTETAASVLGRHLLRVAKIWCEPVFVQNTEPALEVHVSRFLLAALERLEGVGEVNTGSAVVPPLLRGVTVRLELSPQAAAETRRFGMKIGEALAHQHLGQSSLRFEELHNTPSDDDDDDDDNDSKNNTQTREQPQNRVLQKQGKSTTKRCKKTKTLDPDLLYDSSSDDESDDDDDDDDDEGNHNDNSDDDSDDDSSWVEGLVPYNLRDDEQDLSPTAAPLYLRDCLELLRTPETEENAPTNHETALKALVHLVRSGPSDLPDVAVPLARQLLHMENKFGLFDDNHIANDDDNDNTFATIRINGLIALVVQEPVVVAEYLVGDLFRSASLETRTDILTTLEQGALELCGWKELGAKTTRIALDGGPATPTLPSQEIGANNDDKNESGPSTTATRTTTRRWRRPRKDPVRVTNKFGELAAPWFYAMVGGFVENKDNTGLWGGANGAHLLSRFLKTLACIVDCCASVGAGRTILARDLAVFAWSFHDSNVSEIRSATLLALGTGVSLLRGKGDDDSNNDAAWVDFMVGMNSSFPHELQRIAVHDPNPQCRKLASSIMHTCQQSLALLDG